MASLSAHHTLRSVSSVILELWLRLCYVQSWELTDYHRSFCARMPFATYLICITTESDWQILLFLCLLDHETSI